MVKYFVLIQTILILLIGSLQSFAQKDIEPDKHALELLIATQAINYFADSLNLSKGPNQLPHILADFLLDWKITNGFCDYVTPINLSFRKAIIDRVVREEVLQWIIDAKNPAYDSLYDPVKLKLHNRLSKTLIYHPMEERYCELPFMKLSIRDLARVRLATLRLNRRRIEG
jgi:hypothetical protein